MWSKIVSLFRRSRQQEQIIPLIKFFKENPDNFELRHEWKRPHTVCYLYDVLNDIHYKILMGISSGEIVAPKNLKLSKTEFSLLCESLREWMFKKEELAKSIEANMQAQYREELNSLYREES